MYDILIVSKELNYMVQHPNKQLKLHMDQHITTSMSGP